MIILETIKLQKTGITRSLENFGILCPIIKLLTYLSAWLIINRHVAVNAPHRHVAVSNNAKISKYLTILKEDST